MGGWSLRTAQGTRALTLAELEQLVRSGAVGAADEVSNGGAWLPVAQVPYLRRLLPQAESAAGAHGPAPAPPPQPGRPLAPQQIATLLAASSDAPRNDRIRRVARLVKIGAALLLAAETYWMFDLLSRAKALP